MKDVREYSQKNYKISSVSGILPHWHLGSVTGLWKLPQEDNVSAGDLKEG